MSIFLNESFINNFKVVSVKKIKWEEKKKYSKSNVDGEKMQKRKLNDIRRLNERIFLAAGNFLRMFCRFDVSTEAPDIRRNSDIWMLDDFAHFQMCSVRNEE